MARRGQHSQEQLKELLLNAADTIVREEGYTALKARKIALEIGYTVGSIYMVFDNMADLIMHVKARTLDDLARELDQVVEGSSAEQTIVALAKHYLHFAKQNFRRWHMVFDDCQPEQSMQPPQWYRDKANHLFERIENLFRALSPGPADDQARLAARTLWSGVHGVCMLALSGKLELVGVDNIDDTVELLVKSFLTGWLATTDQSATTTT